MSGSDDECPPGLNDANAPEDHGTDQDKDDASSDGALPNLVSTDEDSCFNEEQENEKDEHVSGLDDECLPALIETDSSEDDCRDQEKDDNWSDGDAPRLAVTDGNASSNEAGPRLGPTDDIISSYGDVPRLVRNVNNVSADEAGATLVATEDNISSDGAVSRLVETDDNASSDVAGSVIGVTDGNDSSDEAMPGLLSKEDGALSKVVVTDGNASSDGTAPMLVAKDKDTCVDESEAEKENEESEEKWKDHARKWLLDGTKKGRTDAMHQLIKLAMGKSGFYIEPKFIPKRLLHEETVLRVIDSIIEHSVGNVMDSSLANILRFILVAKL